MPNDRDENPIKRLQPNECGALQWWLILFFYCFTDKRKAEIAAAIITALIFASVIAFYLFETYRNGICEFTKLCEVAKRV